MAEVEFTGERVIPGLVDPDLFNEHVARYRFAAWFLGLRGDSSRILDAACGSGYGARELAAAGTVVSADIAAEATQLARGVTDAVVQASCEALPFAEKSFDAITAFEMIEHLGDAGAFLRGARTVMREDGVLLISTPNRTYYAEARGAAGPNPFHTREYDYEEFRRALEAVFPHVRVWTQNHAAGIVFAPATPGPAGAVLEAEPAADAASAHFFMAACSAVPLDAGRVFAWIPDSGNILRERERHIARLAGELAKKDQWLADLQMAHATLQSAHTATEAELRERNRWAESLNQEIAANAKEIAAAAETIAGLEREADERLAWMRQVEAELNAARARIAELDRQILERTNWAQSLESEKNQAIQAYRELEAAAEARLAEAREALEQAQERHARHLRLIADSRWVRLGRRLNVGPEIG